jgi:hypothetical protein
MKGMTCSGLEFGTRGQVPRPKIERLSQTLVLFYALIWKFSYLRDGKGEY